MNSIDSQAGAMPAGEWRVSVAPMMDCTDRHCRYFLRLLSPRVRLYTEMLTAAAIVRGSADRLLRFDPSEEPVAVQLGGSDPALLAAAAKRASDYGYDEINLNAGCPSERVSDGAFGACLMKSPDLVGQCVVAMQGVTPVPVTVKTRIGLDDRDDYGFVRDFVGVVAAAGCKTFILHARKAYLSGLSPKENRTVPPLRYDVVYQLRRDFPDLRLIINGGIDSADGVRQHLAAGLDGVMIGRKAYADPWWLTELDAAFLVADGRGGPQSRAAVVAGMVDYARRECQSGTRLHHISRHLLGLYHGQPGARSWRRAITLGAARPDASPDVLLSALDEVGENSVSKGVLSNG
ncbi:MAG: tRNA dihydrouridine(20/20a) synthase DusA [Gammaproteobacteria bacterium]|jgi:tRNA-dihydrouridine synthase A|nr:tRNA dihydrouridine(20/20a) synthase DusA [Gammaproteobacteria bacterium]